MAEKITKTPTPLELVDTVNDIIDDKLDKTGTAAAASTLTGLTATVAELNKLDGVTATAAEINKLDGLTATTTELNYVDGVTSNIQTQLNSKAASSHDHSAANITSGTLSADRLATSGATAGSYGPSANASPGSAGTFSVPYLTVDNKGRVTAASTKTITMPTVSSGGISLSSNVTTTASTEATKSYIDVQYGYRDSKNKYSQIQISVSGAGTYTQTGITSGSAEITATGTLTETSGIPAGTYTLQALLQNLVQKSHTHTFTITRHGWNCNCDCSDSG